MKTNRIHIHQDDVPWGDYSRYYPDDLLNTLRAKRFVGPGGAIPHDEVLMGLLELDPGADYPAHRHDAPELYYVTSGRADCVFGDQTFAARTGSIIRTPPGEIHKFHNPGPEKFVAIGVWWAPGGKTEVLRCDLELTDEKD